MIVLKQSIFLFTEALKIFELSLVKTLNLLYKIYAVSFFFYTFITFYAKNEN